MSSLVHIIKYIHHGLRDRPSAHLLEPSRLVFQRMLGPRHIRDAEDIRVFDSIEVRHDRELPLPRTDRLLDHRAKTFGLSLVGGSLRSDVGIDRGAPPGSDDQLEILPEGEYLVAVILGEMIGVGKIE